jgi:hypothetical protein
MAIGPVGVWEPTKYTNLLSSNINEWVSLKIFNYKKLFLGNYLPEGAWRMLGTVPSLSIVRGLLCSNCYVYKYDADKFMNMIYGKVMVCLSLAWKILTSQHI